MKIMSDQEIKSKFTKKEIDLKEYSKTRTALIEPIKAGPKKGMMDSLVDAIRSIGTLLKDTLSNQQKDSQESKQLLYTLFSRMIDLQENISKPVKPEKADKKRYIFRFERSGDGSIKKIYVNEE